MRSYICGARPMGSCPIGWTLFERNCYLINTGRKATWTVAKDACESVGAQLWSHHCHYLHCLTHKKFGKFQHFRKNLKKNSKNLKTFSKKYQIFSDKFK